MKIPSIRRTAIAPDPRICPPVSQRRARRDPMALATALLAVVGAAVIAASAAAESEMVAGAAGGGCPRCKEGVCYQEVVTYRCKQVPDNKQEKKIVYECREVPYCQHKLPRLGHGDCCPECEACPKFKKVLVKKEIVVGETCGTKCVPEKFVERIPVPCCRCGYSPPGAITSPASPAASATEPATLPAVAPTGPPNHGPTPATRATGDDAAQSNASDSTSLRNTTRPASTSRASERRTAVIATNRSAAIAERLPSTEPATLTTPRSERLPPLGDQPGKAVRRSIRDEAAAPGIQPLEGRLIRLTSPQSH